MHENFCVPAAKGSKKWSSLNLKMRNPLEKQELVKINTMLTHLENHVDSFDFLEPVDWQGMELYDYPEIIKYPMDLSTVNKKIKDKTYKYVQAVLNDIQCIWDNCKAYNPQNSEIYTLADKLEGVFRKMMKNYLPNIKVPSATLNPEQKTQSIQLPPFTIVYEPIRSKPPTADSQRQQFINKLKTMPNQNLQKILQTITQLNPSALIEMQNGYAKLDLRKLDSFGFYRACQQQCQYSGCQMRQVESA